VILSSQLLAVITLSELPAVIYEAQCHVREVSQVKVNIGGEQFFPHNCPVVKCALSALIANFVT
jgi:hypothetical protein